MRAVWARAKNEMRAHWRAITALCLLAGFPGGVALASAIGASRTDSVVDRLVAKTKAPDIFMVPDFQENKVPFESIARLPVVSEARIFRGFGPVAPTPADLEISAPHEFDLSASRAKILSGRLPRPDRTDEAVITFKTADRYHWGLGTIVSLALAGAGSDPTSGGPAKAGPVVTVHVVGVVANAGDFVSVAGPGLQLTSAFERMYAPRAATIRVYLFSLRHGSADLKEFEKGVSLLSGGKPVLYTEAISDVAQVKRTFHLQAAALWIMCLFLGVVAILILGQSIARQAALESVEYPTLSALGMTRRDLVALGFVRAGVVGLGAAALAVVVGLLLSLFTPFGMARIAEPKPGLWAPGLLLLIGIGAILFVVSGLSIVPSLRASRVSGSADASGARPSLASRVLSGLTSRPSPTIGARFALEPGRGRTAVPVRSSLVAIIAGIVALLAALIVAASVQHLLVSPPLYGMNWDVAFSDNSGSVSFAPGSKELKALSSDPTIADLAAGVYTGATFRLNGVGMDGIAVDAIKGDIEPTILEGRAPKGADEVVVGRKSLQAAHAGIGSSVLVGIIGQANAPQAMRVVGITILPFDDDTSSIGEGLWMTFAGIQGLVPGVPKDSAIIRFAPGVAKGPAIKRLQARFAGDYSSLDLPNGVRDFGRVSRMPLVLAGVLAALAAGTLAHMLTSSIRRRRRDLAILKTLGLGKGQVRAAVAWQAAVFTGTALVVAVPLGLVAGRWMWNVVARYGGFAPAAIVPAAQFGIVCAGSLVVAALVAVWPARAAARTEPALVLRAE
jgi:ABC-type antimicrobial peptide transport system permease subunit